MNRINTTSDISKLSQISRAVRRVKLSITISKYHSWYLCQISLQIMLLPILISHSSILNTYYRLCGFQSSLLLIYFLYGPDTVLLRYVSIHFRDQQGAASLRYRNPAEMTVVMSELKRYPIPFSCRHKS